VSITDYVVDILLILVIFRAVRPHPLTLRAALLPLILLAVAGIIYLRPVALRGKASVKRTSRGYLYGASCALT